MKRMLINATQPEELRVAIADGQKLIDLDIEIPAKEQRKNNVYKGRITRVEPSLEAAFVDYGAERHGFLPLKDIAKSYLSEPSKSSDARSETRATVKEGTEVIVQVEKEERGNKGAALSTFVSLAGRYSVLMPNSPRAGGVSRQVLGEDRKLLREAISQLEIPPGMGLILRTVGVGHDVEELQWDLDYLVSIWQAISTAAESQSAPFLIYQESNLIIRALRDYLRDDIGEILIDREDLYENAKHFMQNVMPHNLRKLNLYRDTVPLFNRYQIENQIENAFARQVSLTSGGSMVFDPTEALISIDINSARATKGSDIEETALNTNMEAAEEIARQLRIRDLGGLIVIDFIDMFQNRNQHAVEERLKEAMRSDRARVQIGRISKFGLLEMSRQRLRPSLKEASQEVCPRCNGRGTIRGVESLALAMLRLLEDEAMKENSGRVIAHAPVDTANFLLNEKRVALASIQHRHGVPILVVANPTLTTPAYRIERVREKDLSGTPEPTYALVDEPEFIYEGAAVSDSHSAEKPAVGNLTPATPAPTKAQKGTLSRLLKSLRSMLGSSSESSRAKPHRQRDQSRPRSPDHRKRNRPSRGRQNVKQSQTQARTGKTRDKQGGEKRVPARKSGKSLARGANKAKPAATRTKQQPDSASTSASSDSAPTRSGTRRGRRGGRRRRGGQNRAATPDQQTALDQTTTSPQSSDVPVSQTAAAKSNAQAAQSDLMKTPGSSKISDAAVADTIPSEKSKQETSTASAGSESTNPKRPPRRRRPRKAALDKEHESAVKGPAGTATDSVQTIPATSSSDTSGPSNPVSPAADATDKASASSGVVKSAQAAIQTPAAEGTQTQVAKTGAHTPTSRAGKSPEPLTEDHLPATAGSKKAKQPPQKAASRQPKQSTEPPRSAVVQTQVETTHASHTESDSSATTVKRDKAKESSSRNTGTDPGTNELDTAQIKETKHRSPVQSKPRARPDPLAPPPPRPEPLAQAVATSLYAPELAGMISRPIQRKSESQVTPDQASVPEDKSVSNPEAHSESRPTVVKSKKEKDEATSAGDSNGSGNAD